MEFITENMRQNYDVIVVESCGSWSVKHDKLGIGVKSGTREAIQEAADAVNAKVFFMELIME